MNLMANFPYGGVLFCVVLQFFINIHMCSDKKKDIAIWITRGTKYTSVINFLVHN